MGLVALQRFWESFWIYLVIGMVFVVLGVLLALNRITSRFSRRWRGCPGGR